MNKHASMKRRNMIGNTITYIVLVLISIVWLFPFVGMLLQSFRSYKPSVEYGGMVDYLIPKTFSLDNYKFLFSGETNFLLWYKNTLIIAIVVAVALQRWVWTNDYQGYFTRFCAGGILVAIPVTLLFMFLQKYYVEGVTGGAVKG